ncbi:hypothetical protein GWK47_013992 [Chionoecetes opilio]|uniref:Uncharacterized protein n=1 Tax=Chionoecetes opilio TaxID=41210 RepID=A0A8J4Y432_CHIOP|nr:hypothetical protein GWK47_013992 [Chionoecetes opilio]
MRTLAVFLACVVVGSTFVLGMDLPYRGDSRPAAGGDQTGSSSGTFAGAAGQSGTAADGDRSTLGGASRPVGGLSAAGSQGGNSFQGFGGAVDQGGAAFVVGSGGQGFAPSVLQQQIVPTVTQTVTVDTFTTLTDTVFQSYGVTLTQFAVQSVTRPIQQRATGRHGFDHRLPTAEKKALAEAMQREEGSEEPPKLITVSDARLASSTLASFGSQASGVLLDTVRAKRAFLSKEPEEWPSDTGFVAASRRVASLHVTNDTAERGVALFQSFNLSLTKNEHQRQFLLQVLRPEYITLTETKSDFRLAVRTSVTHVTLTHTSYAITHVPFTITATQTVHITSAVVRTVIDTVSRVVTDYRTLLNTVFVHGGYY